MAKKKDEKDVLVVRDVYILIEKCTTTPIEKCTT